MGSLTGQAHGHLSIKKTDVDRWLHDHHMRGLKYTFEDDDVTRDADGVVRKHPHVYLIADPKEHPRIIAETKAAHDEDVASGALLLII